VNRDIHLNPQTTANDGAVLESKEPQSEEPSGRSLRDGLSAAPSPVKKPLVMFGDTRSARNIRLLTDRGWGRIFASQAPTPFPFEKWGFDNGAFKAWQDAGFPPGLTLDDWAILWDSEGFERRVAEAAECESDPYLAVVPDIPGSADSLEFSLMWVGDLRRDWPWYLAVQDGMDVARVERVLHLFAGIFLGGSDAFKLTAYRWARLAHRHQKKFHYARAGTPRKVRHAFRVGADSLDSTFASWTTQRTNELCHVWDGLDLQEIFPEVWA
jgi:hypothetical protein